MNHLVNHGTSFFLRHLKGSLGTMRVAKLDMRELEASLE